MAKKKTLVGTKIKVTGKMAPAGAKAGAKLPHTTAITFTLDPKKFNKG